MPCFCLTQSPVWALGCRAHKGGPQGSTSVLVIKEVCRPSPEFPRNFVAFTGAPQQVCSWTFVPRFSQRPKSNPAITCPVALGPHRTWLHVFKVLLLQRIKMLYELRVAASSGIKGTITHVTTGDMRQGPCRRAAVSQDFDSATPDFSSCFAVFLQRWDLLRASVSLHIAGIIMF